MRRIASFVFLAACSGKGDSDSADTAATDTDTTDTDTATDTDTDTDTGNTQGACGDPVLYDLQVLGRVTGFDGALSVGAHVVVEDRVWAPGILGEAYTDAKGNFTVDVVGLTSLPDCWGLLGYYVVADKGPFSGERGINSELFNAVDSGTLVADLTAFPIEMEETSR